MTGAEQDLVSERYRITPVRAENNSQQQLLVILQVGASVPKTELQKSVSGEKSSLLSWAWQ